VVAGKTEREYFNDLRGLDHPCPSISVAIKDKNPLRQLQVALTHQDSGDFDEVWLVFDVDYFEDSEIKQALKQAEAAGVRRAVSNPCFEYWLMLHFKPYNRFIESPTHAEKLVQKHYVPGYSKANPRIDQFRDRRETAVANGRARSKVAGDYTVNPTTEVWQLVEEILKDRDADKH
jgi:hypothetical protein